MAARTAVARVRAYTPTTEPTFHAATQRGQRSWPLMRSRLRAVWCVACLTIAIVDAAVTPARAQASMPRISVRAGRLYAGSKPWRAWGLNWGVGTHEPLQDYFDHPTTAHLAVLRTELATAKHMGANSMRIYLQLAEVMVAPNQTRPSTLAALTRLLALAERDHIYLDITGDLVWQPLRAPAWYARLGWRARWQVQARFWRAVAKAAAPSDAVLCYELTSEPIVAQTAGYYYGDTAGRWFVQSVATSPASAADQVARAWTRLLVDAVHSADRRPVSIGLLPAMSGPFSPANVAGLLDLLIVHEYPTTGHAQAAVSMIRSFASHRKPLLLGETFTLNDDLATEGAFLAGAAPYLSGSFEFFDGRDPRRLRVGSIYDAVYQAGLAQFLALRHFLLTA